MTLPKSSSINAYGSGVLVDAVPLVDPTSELGAAALNPLRNDVAAMTATVPRCILQFTGTSSPTASIFSSATWTAGNDSNWGNAFAVQPVIYRVSTGQYMIKLPSTVSDQIGGTNLVSVRMASCQMISITGPNTNAYNLVAPFISTNTSDSVTVYISVWNRNGDYDDYVGAKFGVVIY